MNLRVKEYGWALAAGMLAVVPAQAQSGFDGGMGDPMAAKPSQVSFVSEVNEFAPGKPFEVMLDLKHPAHWHSYYRNPGTMGMTLDAKWTLPPGFTVEPVQWPVPVKGNAEGVTFYGYDHPQFLYRVTPPADWKPGTPAVLKIQPTWQICSTGCLMEPANDGAAWTIELGSAAAPVVNAGLAAEFASARAAMPVPAVDWKLSARKEGGKYIIDLQPEAGANAELESAYFFSNVNVIDPAAPQKLVKTANGYQLEMAANTPENDMYPMPENPDVTELKGILTAKPGLLKGRQVAGFLVDVKLGGAAKPAGAAEAGKASTAAGAGESAGGTPENGQAPPKEGLLTIIGLMFLGGMVLNLMPCVFPVIGLKVMGFVELGGGERRKVVSHAVAFVVGVLLSFWALTGILLVLKQSNPDINWADWFTYPGVVFGMLLLMLVLSLSMAGVFELGASATSVGGKLTAKHGYSGSFFSGILATLIATPCSGPFIGTAIALALALDPAGMVLAFTGMGLGMASPYLVLGAFPKLVSYLPRPGAWMETFKQAMAFILFGAVAWLVYTYLASFESHQDKILNMLFGLVLVAMATWIYGRWTQPWQKVRTRVLAYVAAALAFAAGFKLAMPPANEDASAVAASGEVPQIDWSEAWSKEKVEKALAEGRPVFIDFTARWCLTCQSNKKTAYTPAVRELFKKYNILPMRADKTLANPAIDAEIKRLKRSAVPINVLWIPGDPEPHITRELLTGDYLVEFLDKYLAGKKFEGAKP